MFLFFRGWNVKALVYLVCAALIVIGAIFLIGSTTNTGPRLAVGALLLSCGAIVAVFVARSSSRRADSPDRIEQHIELSGDVNLEQMACRQCGGALSSKNVEVKAGAVFVKCPYCSAGYQIEEKPKW
jgi:hypothetical protein